jgi:hypothetical protein
MINTKKKSKRHSKKIQNGGNDVQVNFLVVKYPTDTLLPHLSYKCNTDLKKSVSFTPLLAYTIIKFIDTKTLRIQLSIDGKTPIRNLAEFIETNRLTIRLNPLLEYPKSIFILNDHTLVTQKPTAEEENKEREREIAAKDSEISTVLADMEFLQSDLAFLQSKLAKLRAEKAALPL